MQITLLGTGAAEGWPGLFCNCKVCSHARKKRGKNLRTRSSLMIDNCFKFDFPPDTLHHLFECNLDLRSLKAIFFTHSHDDHFAPKELQYTRDFFVTEPLPQPIPIYAPDDIILTLQTLLPVSQLPLTLHELHPRQTVNINGYQFIPFAAHHDPNIICLNYIVRDPYGITLLYASDTGWYPEETWNFLESETFDAMVVECTNGDIEGGYDRHLGISDVIRMKNRLEKSGSLLSGAVVTATHFSHQGGLNHEELENRLSQEGIFAAYDGYTIQIKNMQRS